VDFFYQQTLAFDQGSFEHRLLLVLSDSVLVLLALTMVFGVLALVLRIQHNRHEGLWRGLHQLWGTDILNVLSGDMSPNDFRKLIKPEHELNFVRFVAPYGWRLRGSDLDILKNLVQHYMPHVARQLQHKDPGVRAWAVNVISLFGMPAYEFEVFKAIEDKAAVVVMFAASTLLAQKRVHYITPVLEHVQRFDKWNINALASLLSAMGPEAVPILEKIYLNPNRNLRTRRVAALALANFAHYAVADAAAAQLAATSDRDLVVATLKLLQQIGQPHHRAAIKDLCVAPSEVLRINAMRTLRAICTQEDREFLADALGDSSPWVARQAVWALKDLGAVELLEKLVRDGHPRAALARQALGGAAAT
jgi:HEAT repeat protein